MLQRNCLQKVTLASVIFALACGNDQRVPTAPTVPMHPPPVCLTDVSAVSQDGLAVTVHFDVPTVDRVTAVCSPPPGSLFQVGTHEVTCARSDNPDARCSFLVTVTLRGGSLVERGLDVSQGLLVIVDGGKGAPGGRAESLPPPRPGATVSVAQARERGELLGQARAAGVAAAAPARLQPSGVRRGPRRPQVAPA